jgi:hypothetical protein
MAANARRLPMWRVDNLGFAQNLCEIYPEFAQFFQRFTGRSPSFWGVWLEKPELKIVQSGAFFRFPY